MQNLIPLIHPAMMWGSLGLYFYIGYLGWQSRRIRFVKGEQRKELIQNHVGAKHAKIAPLLLGLFVIGGSIGAIVTYLHSGVFLGGLHGKIGALMMLLIIGTSCLAPMMKRGVPWARTVHGLIGAVLFLLYLVEIPSGMRIMQAILAAK